MAQADAVAGGALGDGEVDRQGVSCRSCSAGSGIGGCREGVRRHGGGPGIVVASRIAGQGVRRGVLDRGVSVQHKSDAPDGRRGRISSDIEVPGRQRRQFDHGPVGQDPEILIRIRIHQREARDGVRRWRRRSQGGADLSEEGAQDRINLIASPRRSLADDDHVPFGNHEADIDVQPARGVRAVRRGRPHAAPVGPDAARPPVEAVVSGSVEIRAAGAPRQVLSHLWGRGLIHPGGADQLLSGPIAPVEKEMAEPGHLPCGEPDPRRPVSGPSVDAAVVETGPARPVSPVPPGHADLHHSNLRLPIRLERWLNRFLVTPRMHGIHHSQVRRETNSNYDVVFSRSRQM